MQAEYATHCAVCALLPGQKELQANDAGTFERRLLQPAMQECKKVQFADLIDLGIASF